MSTEPKIDNVRKTHIFSDMEQEHVDAVNMKQERVDETAKRKHEWVGLTEADIYEAIGVEDEFDFAKAIEAKLREKNT